MKAITKLSTVMLVTLFSTFQLPTVAPSDVTYVPGQLVVKYADSVSDSVQRIVQSGGFDSFFSGAQPDPNTGLVSGSTLDNLHANIGLYQLECTFIDRSELDNEEAIAQQNAYYSTLANRYPKRAARQNLAGIPDRTNTYLLRFSENIDVEMLAEKYAADSAVEWAEPNYTGGGLMACPPGLPPSMPTCLIPTPDDYFLGTCESHSHIGFEDLWGRFDVELFDGWCPATGSTGSGIVVAVLDTGGDYTHPDLGPNLWINDLEDINSSGAFEPWPNTVQCGACTDSTGGFGVGHRYRCDEDANCNSPVDPLCPTVVGPACDPSDICTCTAGDLDSVDNNVPTNNYVDDVIGYDFFEKLPSVVINPDPRDTRGHGTLIAGIVASLAGNSLGVVGYAPDARVMILQVHSDYGTLPEITPSTRLAETFDYAVANSADVISLSIKPNTSSLVNDAIAAANAAGVVIFAAAGNGGDEPVLYPANRPEVISVGGSNLDDEWWSEASFGELLELVAPSGNNTAPFERRAAIFGPLAFNSDYSNHPDFVPFRVFPATESAGYFFVSGTSFASPGAAGAGALLLSTQGDLTPTMIRHGLRNTADDLDGPVSKPAWDKWTGFGRLNVRRALSLLSDLPVGSTRALPVEVTHTNKPYSTILTTGSPPRTVKHRGDFFLPPPPTSGSDPWDINPKGRNVTLRIENPIDGVGFEATIPGTDPTYCAANPNNECFTDYQGGYRYFDGAGTPPFRGIKELYMIPTATPNVWKLYVRGRKMDDTGSDRFSDIFQGVPGTQRAERRWGVTIANGPTLRSNIVYVVKGNQDQKLYYPK